MASRTTSPGARLNIAKDWSSSDVFFKFNRVDNPAYYISLGVVDYGSGQHGYHWSMFSGGVDYTNFLTFRNGKVGIGDTSPSYKLDVNGTIRGYGITDSSDVRLKKNITTLDSALDKITQLRGVSYDWRTDEYPELDLSTSTQIGIIAQELELQYPELVNTDIDGYKSIQYGKLTGVLIEGINEIINILDITDAPTSTPSMYVDSNGNVGIGTTSPYSDFQIGTRAHMGDNYGAGYLSGNAYFDGSNWKYTSINGAEVIHLGTAGQINFMTAPAGEVGNTATMATTMTLDNTGNVGIGTTVPGSNLEIEGTTGVTIADSSNPTTHWTRLYHDSAGNAPFKIAMNSGASEVDVMTFEQGNVGIGTTSPGAKLDVAGKVRHDEVDELNWSGDAAGNQTLSVSFTYAGYAMCEITAVASHVGIMTDYSCVRKSFIGKYSTTVFALDAYSHSTTTHGSWTYAYAEDPDRIVITKTAGTYGGGGSYWITVRAKAGENIAKYE